MRPITKNAVRKLRRMRWRTVAIALVLALAMSMFVAGMYGGAVMDESVSSFFDRAGMPDVFVEFSAPANATNVSLALDAAQGVGAYDLRREAAGTYTFENEAIQALLLGVEDLSREDINRNEVLAGRLPAASGEAVAVSGMEGKGVSEGSTIDVFVAGQSLSLSVTGLVRNPEYVFPTATTDIALPTLGTLLVLYLPLQDLEAVVGPGVNDAVLLLDPGADRADAVAALAPFGVDSVVFRESHPSVLFMSVGSAKLKNMFPVVGAVFLFIGFITAFMTMMRLVQTDARYIGVLMSLGFTRGDIVRSYLVLGLLLTAVGAVLGVVLSILFTAGMINAALNLYLTVDIVFPFDPLPFFLGVGFIAFVVLVSTWVPIQLLTRATVRAALEYKPRAAVRTSRALSRSRSRLTRMGLRNVARNPGRMAVTMVVVGLTIGSAGMWLVLTDSAFTFMSGQIEANTWDVRIDFAAPMSAGGVNASALGLDPGGVTYVIPYTAFAAEASLGSTATGALVLASDQVAATKDFSVRQGTLDFGGAVISGGLADDLGAGTGDEITIALGPERALLTVTGIVEEALARTVYTVPANVEEMSSRDNATGAFVQLADADAGRGVARDLRALPFVAAVVVQQDLVDSFEEMLTLAQGFFLTFFLISAVITLSVAGSAVIISAMERDVEFATLDTLGFSRWAVAKVVVVEMAVLGVVASLIGIPMGYAIADLMAGAFAEVLFPFPVVLLLGAAVMTFVMGLAFVLLSSVMPIRYSWKLDTDRTIRERTAG